MESWAKRRIPALAALRFARADQLQQLIEAAKQWLHRVSSAANV
ncbi:hypothetical protein AAFM48_05950 [Burkholderia pseudomallei]